VPIRRTYWGRVALGVQHMRSYGAVSPRFWSGETGRRIRKIGDPEVIVALYLMTCPNSTMTGLYYLPIVTLAHETGRAFEGASKALRSLLSIGFCFYDEVQEVVFVTTMIEWQTGKTLKPRDNQVKGINTALEPYLNTQHYPLFWEKYQHTHHLRHPPPKPLISPFEGASKGLPTGQDRTETGTETETEAGGVVGEPDVLEKSTNVLMELNRQAGTKFPIASLSMIRDIAKRIRGEEGEPAASVDDCELVIAHRVAAWAGTEREEFLRPQTLFAANKFTGYLTVARAWDAQGRPERAEAESGHRRPSDINNAPVHPAETSLEDLEQYREKGNNPF